MDLGQIASGPSFRVVERPSVQLASGYFTFPCSIVGSARKRTEAFALGTVGPSEP